MNRDVIHFVGIGGIGMSALARLYKHRGWIVSGSDIIRSEITGELRRENIKVVTGSHRAAHVPKNTQLVVYTPAVGPQNPEIREAKRRGIKTLSLEYATAEIAKNFQTIAITGAHGKSTTTALSALVLMKAGFDPTVLVGTKLKEFKNSNVRVGKSKYLVLEADDFAAKFLAYRPWIAVVTSIDREHLDYYKNIKNIEAAFFKFLLCVKPNGVVILNRDDTRLRRLGGRLQKLRPDTQIMWYSLGDRNAQPVRKILKIPGDHNVSNALAAHAVGRVLKIPETKTRSALGAYHGAWRRFDYQGLFNGARVYADYAHHPTEIKATLQGFREKFPKKKLVVIFQPHQYERTKALFNDFTKAFSNCNELILLDIYEVAGREHAKKNVDISSERLAHAIARQGVRAIYVSPKVDLRSLLHTRLHSVQRSNQRTQQRKISAVIIMMGAGSIWELTKKLMAKNRRYQ